MAGKQSAGILLYRIREGVPEVLLVHPGGPYNRKKDLGAWSIPKGEFEDGEDPLAAAKREFAEELGKPLPEIPFTSLEPVVQKAGKTVFAWTGEADVDVSEISSNVFSMQWPPGSGKWIDVPEVDHAEWFDLTLAKEKINPAQAGLVDQLERLGVFDSL